MLCVDVIAVCIAVCMVKKLKAILYWRFEVPFSPFEGYEGVDYLVALSYTFKYAFDPMLPRRQLSAIQVTAVCYKYLIYLSIKCETKKDVYISLEIPKLIFIP